MAALRYLNVAAKKFVFSFDKVSSKDSDRVGGKNAALGEMIRVLKKQGVRVPDGFATTAEAFCLFVRENKIDKKIRTEIRRLKKGTRAFSQRQISKASGGTDSRGVPGALQALQNARGRCRSPQ